MADSTREAIVITLTNEDIEKIRNGGIVTVDNGTIALTHRDNTSANLEEYEFTIVMRDRHLNKVEKGEDSMPENITYGINHTGEKVEEVYVRYGTVSEHVGTDKSERERVIESGMSPEEADRYM